MKRLHYALVGLTLLLLSGCGQIVVETLQVPQEPWSNAAGRGKTIVILPFADYTYADSLASAYRREMAITESLTDRLVTNGFFLPNQEDVFDYLVDQNIISIANYDQHNLVSRSNGQETLINELEDGEWSDFMKNQLQSYIAEQKSAHDNPITASPGTHSLTEQTIAKIGHKFNADFIVRGRILEFRTREEYTLAPWKRGIVPFILAPIRPLLVGFASIRDYDPGFADNSGGHENRNNMTTGWVSGQQTYDSSKDDQAVVQLRIWVQETGTGNVVWSNRIDVKVSPETSLADKQYDTLFNQAIEKGTTTLIDNFITSVFHVAPVKFVPPPVSDPTIREQ